jgi:hypothetical protein
VHNCCKTNQFASCADCKDFQNPSDCRKFNNWISKVFGFIFRSDRAACICQIRELGIESHAANMAKNKWQTIKR